MAANLNRVLLIGNLTRDPELRYLTSGRAVTSFSIAVNRSYTTQTGEKKEETAFVRIVTWAKRAEVCNEYLKKGSPVFVEGRLQSRSWEAQDGSKRSTIEVVADNVQSWFQLNPPYVFIQSIRDLILQQTIPGLDQWAMMVGWLLLFLLVGSLVLQKLRYEVREYI